MFVTSLAPSLSRSLPAGRLVPTGGARRLLLANPNMDFLASFSHLFSAFPSARLSLVSSFMCVTYDLQCQCTWPGRGACGKPPKHQQCKLTNCLTGFCLFFLPLWSQLVAFMSALNRRLSIILINDTFIHTFITLFVYLFEPFHHLLAVFHHYQAIY